MVFKFKMKKSVEFSSFGHFLVPTEVSGGIFTLVDISPKCHPHKKTNVPSRCELFFHIMFLYYSKLGI
jgi:hypothetical protein